jgi:GT2 family glycosyltransferase
MLTFGTVICTYNRKHLLEQCLESWNQSSRLPDQFIVVDATTNAEDYREAIIQRFPQLFTHPDSQYIVSSQPGLTLQRNLGLKTIKTDVVCFADDDAFISREYVTKIIEVFERDTQKQIGGVNGVGTGQFDNARQKYFRLFRNHARHHFGWLFQRIYIPRSHTKLFEAIAPELQELPLIHIDRLWGANMNYRAELIATSGFDENFKHYGLFEDVDMSVRVGKTHKLVCRLDAEVTHDDSLGKTTRPSDAKYFLASWVNSAYIIEKLFPCSESRNAYQRFFNLICLLSKHGPKKFSEDRFRTFGNEELFTLARNYILQLQNCPDPKTLSTTFIQLQNEISQLNVLTG